MISIVGDGISGVISIVPQVRMDIKNPAGDKSFQLILPDTPV
jgi:hypothetical protein